jgi:hypothetical protein
MDSEDSLDTFLMKINTLIDTSEVEEEVEEVIEEEESEHSDDGLNRAPKLDGGIFCRFPLLMKNTPRNKDSTKSFDCKKCQVTKKRLEEKIDKLEADIQLQQDQLFEAYSHLNARVSELEQKRLRTK